jgi:threonine synthase
LAASTKQSGRKVGLLVATSGDTGTAALTGFARSGLPVCVLYPHGGVSPVQEAQMATAA